MWLYLRCAAGFVFVCNWPYFDLCHFVCVSYPLCWYRCQRAGEKWINTCSFRSPVVDEERMRPGHGLESVLWVCFSALTLLVGDGDGVRHVTNLCHSSTKVVFQNKWWKKAKEEVSWPGSPGRRWWWTCPLTPYFKNLTHFYTEIHYMTAFCFIKRVVTLL